MLRWFHRTAPTATLRTNLVSGTALPSGMLRLEAKRGNQGHNSSTTSETRRLADVRKIPPLDCPATSPRKLSSGLSSITMAPCRAARKVTRVGRLVLPDVPTTISTSHSEAACMAIGMLSTGTMVPDRHMTGKRTKNEISGACWSSNPPKSPTRFHEDPENLACRCGRHRKPPVSRRPRAVPGPRCLDLTARRGPSRGARGDAAARAE